MCRNPDSTVNRQSFKSPFRSLMGVSLVKKSSPDKVGAAFLNSILPPPFGSTRLAALRRDHYEEEVRTSNIVGIRESAVAGKRIGIDWFPARRYRQVGRSQNPIFDSYWTICATQDQAVVCE